MAAETTVRKLLMPSLVALVSLVLVTGLLGMAAMVNSLRTMDYLNDELRPALTAHAAVLQDLTDAETGVRAWAQSGLPEALEPYQRGLARLPFHQRRLRTFAGQSGSSELRELVAQQEAAAEAWLEGYARPRVNAPGGPGTFSMVTFREGKERFDAIRDVHAEISERLSDMAAEIRAEAVRNLVISMVVLVLLAAAAFLTALLLGRRVLRQVRDPLEELELVVRRHAGGEVGARAEVAGTTEIRQLGTTFNAMADENERAAAVAEQVQQELRDLDSAKDDFVSNVSHEFRTPLTTINGYLEMVADEFEGRMAPRHARMLDASQRNVDRLRMLIEDLLTLSRAEGRGTDLERIDIQALLTDVVADLRLAAAGRRIEVALEAADGQLVLADPSQLARALSNVVGNAIKFSPDDGRVEVTVVSVGDEVEIRVVDHGIGIPSDDLPYVGARFFRATNAVSSQTPGTGLGLRIVQTIVSNHGGSLALESIEGEGTEVVIRLPAQAGAPV